MLRLKKSFSPHLHQPPGKPLTTTSKSELRSLCVLDICSRISPSRKQTGEGGKIPWPFPCAHKESQQQRATQAGDIWV